MKTTEDSLVDVDDITMQVLGGPRPGVKRPESCEGRRAQCGGFFARLAVDF